MSVECRLSGLARALFAPVNQGITMAIIDRKEILEFTETRAHSWFVQRNSQNVTYVLDGAY